MSRSLSNLRRVLLGAATAGSLAFGATQALASPEQARVKYCGASQDGSPYYSKYCGSGCIGGHGYCNEVGICKCGFIP